MFLYLVQNLVPNIAYPKCLKYIREWQPQYLEYRCPLLFFKKLENLTGTLYMHQVTLALFNIIESFY